MSILCLCFQKREVGASFCLSLFADVLLYTVRDRYTPPPPQINYGSIGVAAKGVDVAPDEFLPSIRLPSTTTETHFSAVN